VNAVRNLLALVGLVVVGFLGTGWYCNWYTLRVQTGTDGKLNLSADVDQKKIGSDVGVFTQKAGQFIQNATTDTPPTAGTKEPAPKTPPTTGK
jgi:hypothetical protein